MSTPSQPTSSKRKKPLSGNFAIRFAPGQEQSDQVFDNIPDIIEYIRDQTDSDVTVYVDLTAVGGAYTLPVRTDYDFRRVYLDGFFNNDGSIPVLVWPEGSRIIDNCGFIRKRDVSFRVDATTTTIWTPNRATRLEDERAADYVSNGGAYFLDYTASGQTVLTYSGGPAAGTEQFGGGPLFKIGSGQTMLAYLDQDTRLNEDSVEGPVDSTLDLRFHVLSLVGNQPNFLGTILKSCFQQSGATFPVQAYPGKLFQKTPENRYYMRNQDDTEWVQLSVPPTVFSNTVVAAATNIFTPYVSGSYNFEQVRPHKITVSWLWALTQTSKDFWGQVRIDGTPVGISDGLNTLVLKSQPFKAGSAPAWAQIAPGLYEIEYTPPTTGSQTIDFRFRASDNTATAYVQGATITIEEVL